MTMSQIKTSEQLMNLTLIEERIRASGRMFKWYAMELGYAVFSGSSEFNRVSKGRKVPNAARRKKLASLLGTKPSALWRIDDNTGRLVARRFKDPINRSGRRAA